MKSLLKTNCRRKVVVAWGESCGCVLAVIQSYRHRMTAEAAAAAAAAAAAL